MAQKRSWIYSKRHYEHVCAHYDPHLKLTPKFGVMLKILIGLLVFITCNQLPYSYWRNKPWVMHNQLYVPPTWNRIPNSVFVKASYQAYMQQRLTLVGYWLVYLCFPLPIVLSLGRLYLLLHAERRVWEIGLIEGWCTIRGVRKRAYLFAELLSSKSSLFCCPLFVARMVCIDAAEHAIEQGLKRGDHGRY